MVCSGCGYANDAGARVCTQCGKRFGAASEVPSAICTNCRATVHGPPGPVPCPYCGARVDIPLPAPPPQAAPPPVARDDDDDDDDEPSFLEKERERQRNSQKRLTRALTAFAIAMGVLVSAAIVGENLTRAKKHASASTSKDLHPSTAPTTPKRARTPSDYASIAIPSCKCAFGDGQSTPLVTLTLLAAPTQDPARPFRLRIVTKSGFSQSSGSEMLPVPDGAVLSLPKDGGVPPAHMGVACDTGYYVLVAGNVATGWSSVDASYRWTTKLPAPMLESKDAGAPPVPNGTDFDAWCSPLDVDSGRVTVPLARGRRASLAVKDGKLR